MAHKDLSVWKRFIAIVTLIYQITQTFKEKLYSIASQIRRVVVSIPFDIAEGSAKKYNRIQTVLYISFGSTSELDTQLLIASNLNFLLSDKY